MVTNSVKLLEFDNYTVFLKVNILDPKKYTLKLMMSVISNFSNASGKIHM